MQLLGGSLVLSPTDLVGFSLCPHLSGLELTAATGERVRPRRADPELELLRRRGLEHERRFLDALRAQGRTVAEVPRLDVADGGLPRSAELTLEAMRSGAGVVYQATFFDGRWLGTADFLLRVDGQSALGPFAYEPADAKLAHEARPGVLLQLCAYAEQLARVQGALPEQVHVVLGDGTVAAFPFRAFAAYFRSSRGRLEASLAEGLGGTYPEPVPHCEACAWSGECDARRRRDDHLSFVADMRRDHAARLAAAGVTTLAALGRMHPVRPVAGVGSPVLERLAGQARLQLAQRESGRVSYELMPPVAGRGLAALPAPSPGDLFLDLEGDPFVGTAGLEYLFGLVEPDAAGGPPVYRAFWAHDAAEEKRAFEAVVDLIHARLSKHPDLHVYHYGAYETSAFKRLMGMHGTRERELDRILRGQVLVDLYRVVKQGVRVSQESYSLKMLEPLYMAPRATAVSEGMGSVVAYEQWRESADGRRLAEIEAYNRDDCLSLFRLREWLELRRRELERPGALARPAQVDPAPSAEQEAREAASDNLAARLVESLPPRAQDRTPEEQAQWLLGQLVSWHRREAKPEWWAYFHRRRMSEDELFDDTESIAGLLYEGVAGKCAQSLVHRYRFDPRQEHKIGEGEKPEDPATGKAAGTVTFIDNARGLLNLKRAARSDAPHPRCLVPSGPIPTSEQREAIARVGEWVLAHGIDAPGPYRAARDLLLRRPPRLGGSQPGGPLMRPGEDVVGAACRIVREMEDSCLAVQGPPGSGKTWTGAQLILSLAASGRRVGVTASSHKAISKLLEEVCAQAERSRRRLRVIQKAPEDGRCAHPLVRSVEDNGEVESAVAGGAVDVVAGTAWLFARPALQDAVHTLVVEEAGQFSLANVLAMAGSARNLVLLGDPRQLAQPSKAAHPPGAEASALEHLLGEHATMPAELGLFLPLTRRLHPEVSRFVSEAFYEGRLESAAACAAQSIDGDAPFGGAGLRWIPVEHGGNRTASAEEAATVARIFTSIVGRSWTDAKGTRRLGSGDVLVVAPYNAQIARLAAALPSGARVGTVDKFQGQEAPVVIYSLAASSAEDAPRGMEFLYSRNRLNVAVSRAQALAVLVGSPALLRAPCRTVEQLRLVSALCRFVEMASPCAAGERP